MSRGHSVIFETASKCLMKDRNGMDLTEAEDIKRWQEYTEELYKKDLQIIMTQIITMV